jgi:hypothetical protein
MGDWKLIKAPDAGLDESGRRRGEATVWQKVKPRAAHPGLADSPGALLQLPSGLRAEPAVTSAPGGTSG